MHTEAKQLLQMCEPVCKDDSWSVDKLMRSMTLVGAFKKS